MKKENEKLLKELELKQKEISVILTQQPIPATKEKEEEKPTKKLHPRNVSSSKGRVEEELAGKIKSKRSLSNNSVGNVSQHSYLQNEKIKIAKYTAKKKAGVAARNDSALRGSQLCKMKGKKEENSHNKSASVKKTKDSEEITYREEKKEQTRIKSDLETRFKSLRREKAKTGFSM